jgi:hypothetical protein
MPRTTPGQGALLRPTFNSTYGVSDIEVLAGGAGYAKTDPPKIEIEGTTSPLTEGVFFPIISGVGTISDVVIFKAGLGYYPVFSTSTQSQVVVERGAFGTIATDHSSAGIAYSVFSGDYNIVDDNIFFSDAPYGKTGPVGLLTGSSFSGRLFSRKLDPFDVADKNTILDDISLEFTGVAGTQFTLTENLGLVTSVYNNVNTGVDINNNPFILINNVVQTPGLDFEIVDNSSNKINFLSGVPRAGRINKVGLQTGSGYYLPTKASARVGVGSTGTIEFLQLEGKGQGYNSVPEISIRSSQGTGAALTAYLGTSSGSAVAISTADYNHIAGICTFVTGATSHGFEEGDRIRITGAGFTFTPVSPNRNIAVFGYDYVTGIATVQVSGGHYIGTASNQSRSLLIKQVQVYNGITTYLWREDAYPIVDIPDANNVSVDAGISTQPLQYVSGGLVQAGVDTAIMDGRNVIGFDVLSGTTTNTFRAFIGVSTFAHQYVSGGVINRAEAGIVTSFAILDGGTGYYAPRTISYIDGTPANGITTLTAYGNQAGGSVAISSVAYDDISGVATITSGSGHGLTTSSVIKLVGIAFSTSDGDITFPSDAQRYYGIKSVVNANNFTINIGAAMTTSGIHTGHIGVGSFIPYQGHGLETDDFVNVTGIAVTFSSAPAVKVGDVEYDETSGIATISTRQKHNLTEDDCVILSGISFTCNYDPALGISSAEYDNTTGVMTVTTSAAHGYKVGKDVVFTGLGFTCQLDNGAQEHYYPRSRSTAFDTGIPIVSTAATTVTVDVGFAPSKDQFTHTFDKALSGALITGGDYKHKFLRAEEGALLTGGEFAHKFVGATADSTFSGGNYEHKFVSSDDKTVKVGGNYAHTFVPSKTIADCIDIVGAGTTTPTNADYNASTGALVLTVPGHGLSGPTSHTITTARYNALVGILTITVPGHNFANGDQIKIDNDAIGFKCSMDGYASTHTYPRSTDPVSDQWIPISNKTTNTFEVFVGMSTIVNYNVTDALYTPSVGVMTMTIGNHDLLAGSSIKIKPSSLGFKCEMDGKTSTKYYPRSTDPVYDTAVPITGIGTTTITVQVGISTIVKYNIRFADYTPAVGILTVSLDRLHGFTAGESIKFKEGSIVFKCARDAFQTNHFYPRPQDPFYNTSVPIVSCAGTIFTCNVGVTTLGNFTHLFVPNQGVAVEGVISGGDYGHTFSGVGTDAVITGGVYDHTFESAVSGGLKRPSTKVEISKGALTFKCAKDNYASEHAYPRTTDPAYNTELGIVDTTSNTFEVRVGVSTVEERAISNAGYNPATGDLTLTVGTGHSYTSATSHTITDAVYNPSTGVMEPTIANHGFLSGDYIKFDNGAITFTCEEDNNATNHPYPRPSDPYSNRWLSIYNVGVNTFSVFVGVSTNTTAHTFASGAAGALKKATDTIGINTSSIVMTCFRDEHKTKHAYPRPDDPVGGNKSIGIGATTADTITVNVGVTTIKNYSITTAAYTASTGIVTVFSNRHGLSGALTQTVNFATYNASAGIMTVTTDGSHNLTTGDRVQFERNSINFRCMMDGRKTIKSYPRASDPVDQQWLAVETVDDTNFKVQVGVSTIVTHSPTSGSYDPFTGLMTVDIGEHYLKKGNAVKLKTRAFKFTCGQDNHATNHFYPRATSISGPDPAYNTSVKITGTTDTTITLDVGKSSNQSDHIFVSASADSVISGGDYVHTFENAIPNNIKIARDTIGLTTNSYTFRCSQDNYGSDHTYPRSGYAHTFVGATAGAAFTSGASFNISTAVYDPEAGSMVMTIPNHGLLVGESIGIVTNSMTFTCARDSHATTHTYPRNSDPIHNKYVSIGATTVNTITLFVGKSNTGDPLNNKEIGILTSTTDTFTFNVGVTTQVRYNITTSSYTPSTGIVTFTTDSSHGLTTATSVGIATNSLIFSCDMDQHATEHAYPRPGYAHTFVSATSGAVLKGGDYAHTYVTSLAGVAFTGGDYKHNFVSAAANSIHVGSWTGTKLTPINASYNAVTGNMVLNFASAHGLIAGSNTVGIATGGIVLTCERDNHETNHAYPRASDPVHGLTNIAIGATTVNTITVNVGVSTIVSSGITTATYAPATGDIELTVGAGHGLLAQSQTTVTNADYNPYAGIMTCTVAGHGWEVGEYVKFDTNSITFTCGIDTHATNHSYPRPSDPFHNTWLPILETTTNTFSVKVLKETPSTSVGVHTFSGSQSNGLKKANNTVGIHTRSITMTCARDAHATQHSYPRDADPINNKQVGIKAVTGTTITINCGITTNVGYNVTGANYNDVNGELELTLGSGHGFVVNDNANVGITTNGLTFTCALDKHASNHTYPRTTDPIHNKIVSIGSTSDTTVTLNCGAANIDDPAHSAGLLPTKITSNTLSLNVGVTTQVKFDVVHADYQESVGVMTMAIGAHSLQMVQTVKLANEAIYFKCSRDGNATSLGYPKGGDPWYNGTLVNRVIDANNIEVNVGVSTVPTHYNSGGTVQGVIIAPREFNNSASGVDYASGGTFVDKIIDDYNYVVNVGISTVDHNYNRGGLSQQGKRVAASIEKGFSGFDVIEKLDAASFRVDAGLTTERALFKRGGRVDKPIFVDIAQPDPYFNRKLEYISGASGLGTDAKVDFRINVDGQIGEFDILEEGTAFKVDEELTVAGIVTDPRVGVLTEFQLTVTELENDTFSGFYPGQFILFDDISAFFNGKRKKFTLSVTTAGTTEILSLKTLPGSDMDITNNIFIYINDILQTPQSSYVFKGSRVIFSEAPKPNSKCSVFYFRGSKRDVETVDPVQSLKPGDVIQIKENRNDPLDIDQFQRTSKRIVASDLLETFTYDSIGINTAQDAERPLTWVKQRQDQILSGVLIPKSRPSLKSKVLPTTRIIKNVGNLDDKIYVNNAYPVFTNIDKLIQSERNIQVFDDGEVSPGIVTSVVSTSSSISSLTIGYAGTGYSNLSSPNVAISSALIKRKDPIKEWRFDGISGITQTVDFKAITQQEPIVAVGSSSYYMNTKSGTFWERGQIGFGGTITFNGVGMGFSYANQGSLNVMAVGDYASMARAVSVGNSISTWTEIDLKEERTIPAINQTGVFDSTYEGNFQDVLWEGTRNIWVAVGAAGSIFTAVGLTTAEAFSQYSGTLQQLNSVCYGQSEFIAVGNGGAVIASNDGTGWGDKISNTAYNINDIIYDGNRFIYVGDNGTIGISTNKNYWQPWSQQLPAGTVHPATFDFKTIKFIDNIYIGISTVGDMYYSFDLANWNKRDINHPNQISDIVDTAFGDFASSRILAVGSATTHFYADPVINAATATASVTAGVITSIIVDDGGFGYEIGSNPPVLIETDKTKKEDIFAVNSQGDFGDIVGINTWLPGSGARLPQLAFTLKSQYNDNTNLGYGYSSLNALGVEYSGLQKGDYFTIYDSSLVVGHALTGITTSSGANEVVGMVTAGDYLGGVFRVEQITTGDAVSGLVTVTCAFEPGPTPYGNNHIQVGVGTTATTDTFWGKYSWGQIYGYQNRGSGNPTEFFVNTLDGNQGLSTAAVVSRLKPLT